MPAAARLRRRAPRPARELRARTARARGARAGRGDARARGSVRVRPACRRDARHDGTDRARAAARARRRRARGRRRDRGRAAEAAQWRARAVRRARAPARRVAARSALARDRASRPADGQGARRSRRRRARRSCSTRAPRPRSAAAPDSSFELAVVSRGRARGPGASPTSRRVRLVVSGGEGEPASAAERSATRRLLARARPAGERSPAELLARLAAEHIEVVTSQPGALVGNRRVRRLGVVAIDPSSFDPERSRDAAALAALTAAGARVRELRRPEPVPVAERPGRPGRELAQRGALYALAGAFGLLARARPADPGALDREPRGDRGPRRGAGLPGGNAHRLVRPWGQTPSGRTAHVRVRPHTCSAPARPARPGSCGARRGLARRGSRAVRRLAARWARRAARRRPVELGAGRPALRAGRAPGAARAGGGRALRLAREPRVALAGAFARARVGFARRVAVRGRRDGLRPAAAALARARGRPPAARVRAHGQARGWRPARGRGVRRGRARKRGGVGGAAGGCAPRRAAVDDVDVRARCAAGQRRPRLGHALPAARLPAQARRDHAGARGAAVVLARHRPDRLRRPALHAAGRRRSSRRAATAERWGSPQRGPGGGCAPRSTSRSPSARSSWRPSSPSATSSRPTPGRSTCWATPRRSSARSLHRACATSRWESIPTRRRLRCAPCRPPIRRA